MGFSTRISLTRYLLIGELAVLLIGMLVMGFWISGVIERRLVHHEGDLFAQYVDSVVSDHVQSVAGGEWLSDADIVALDKLLYRTKLGERIAAFKLWSRDGRILYSTELTAIGARFGPSPELEAAFRGETQSHLSPINDERRQLNGTQRPELIETYAPVRDSRTQSILAVSQVSQTNDVLARVVGTARLQGWMAVIGTTTVMYLLLAALIGRTSKTVVTRQRQLQEKVSQLTILLAQTEDLHERVARAAEGTTALNERFLRRIAADLHDGPGQGLALAMMRLAKLAEVCSPCCSAIVSAGNTVAGEFSKLQQGLNSTLQDMRSISKGLHLPDIEKLPLADIARRVVRDYERTSGMSVRVAISGVPEDAPLPVRITLFRLLQESLANGFRHGGAVNQCIMLDISDNQLRVEVRDEGKGFDPRTAETEGLGLKGMRERVELLGGTFLVWSAAGQGTVIRADLPLTSTLTAHE